MVVLMLGYCLHGLCTLPNMVINAKIMKKSAQSQEKELRYNVHGLCTFPNMVINVDILKNQEKSGKNEDTDVDQCQ